MCIIRSFSRWVAWSLGRSVLAWLCLVPSRKAFSRVWRCPARGIVANLYKRNVLLDCVCLPFSLGLQQMIKRDTRNLIVFRRPCLFRSAFVLSGAVAADVVISAIRAWTAMVGSGQRRTNPKTEPTRQMQSGGSRAVPHGILSKNRSKTGNQLFCMIVFWAVLLSSQWLLKVFGRGDRQKEQKSKELGGPGEM